MADTVNLGGQTRPPQGPESAPKSKPRARKSPPRAGGSTGGSSAPGAPPAPKMSAEDAKLHAALVRMYSMAGIAITGVGQARGDVGIATAGVNVVSIATDTADSWIELAQQNPRVRSALNGLVAGGAAANLIGCHVGIIAPLLAARGAIPASTGMMFLSDEAKDFFRTNAGATTQ